MKKIITLLLLVCIFTTTACTKNENTKDSDKTNNIVEVDLKDYIGVYKSDDSSEIVIEKDKVNISLFRLANLPNCTVDEVKDNVLYINGKDPNGDTIKFTFDYNTKVLKVRHTTWSLISIDDTFTFNN